MAGRTTTARPAGGRSQRLVFFLGLVLAAISAVVVFIIAQSAGDDGGTVGGRVAVVTAREEIAQGTLVTADMLQVSFVAPEEALDDVFTSRSAVVDRLATEDIPAGAQISTGMVSDKTGDSLAFKVSPGMRALSIEVREVVTAGGNIKPGDRVDVIGVFEVDRDADVNSLLSWLAPGHSVELPGPAPGVSEAEAENLDYVVTVTLLQDVRVVAVAQELAPTVRENEGTLIDEEVDSEPRAATATLEITPEQAQLMTLADEYGILRLSARSPGDEESRDVAPIVTTVKRTN